MPTSKSFTYGSLPELWLRQAGKLFPVGASFGSPGPERLKRCIPPAENHNGEPCIRFEIYSGKKNRNGLQPLWLDRNAIVALQYFCSIIPCRVLISTCSL